MNEATLWRYLKKGLAQHCHLTRVESSAGNGVPDVSLGVPHKNVWVELKFIKEWPRRETTLIKLPLRPEQKLWIRARGSMSGGVWVICRICNSYYLLNWKSAIDACDGWTRDQWNTQSDEQWENTVDFDELITIISS